MREAALPAARARDPARRARRLARGFGALVGATSALVVLGALVRAHGAGLACPDWPLCFGELVPRLDFHVGFEYAHRVLAGSIALAFAGLAVAALRDPGLRARVGALLAAAAALLAVQIVLGGLTVLELLAAWTVTSHLVVGNAFNACLLGVALRLRDAAHGLPAAAPRAPGRARVAVALAAAFLALQVLLGGLVSSTYAGMACPEWPACNGGRWFPALAGSVGLHLAHRYNAYLLVAVLLGAAAATRGVARVGPALRLAAALGVAQAAVGVANVRLGIPVEVTGLHSALSALLVLAVAAAITWGYGSARGDAGADGAS